MLNDEGDRNFSISESGMYLRKDSETPLCHWLYHSCDDEMQIPYLSENFINMLKDGKHPSYDLTNGRTIWECFEENRDGIGDSFNIAMKFGTAMNTSSIRHSLDQIENVFITSGESRVKYCDIGGGFGQLTSIVMANYQDRFHDDIFSLIEPTVMDLSQVFENREELFEPYKVDYIGGDFFNSSKIPINQDVYSMKSILHDWSDEDSIKILKNIREAATDGSRVLLFEKILPEVVSEEKGNASVMLDIHMMCLVGGRERTLSEWKDLLFHSGWEYERVAYGNSPIGDGIVVGTI